MVRNARETQMTLSYCIDINGKRFAFATEAKAKAVAADIFKHNGVVAGIYTMPTIDILKEQFPEKFQ
jgi:D-serine deaminase-like pyridoxal phosphate-dependent protein